MTDMKDIDFKSLLTSGKGRINRQLFYIGYGLLVGATWAAAFIDSLLGLQLYQIGDKGIGLLWSLIVFISIYPAIMLYIKRIHDRNRSGWFLLLAMIPLVNIWVLIEVFILKGTVGVNNYGADPLNPTMDNPPQMP